jgi:hypothetical protein
MFDFLQKVPRGGYRVIPHPYQHVCVFLASGYNWVTVMHEIPISSAQTLTSFHTLELSSTIPLVPLKRGLFHMRRFQWVCSIYEGSGATAWWAVPQPRLLPRHNIVGIVEEGQTCVCPPSLTRDNSEGQGQKY